jgi:serine protease Do
MHNAVLRSVRNALFRSAFALSSVVVPAALIIPAAAQAQPLDAPRSFADLAAKLLPAVVNISSSQTVAAGGDHPDAPDMPNFPPGSPFEQFFHDFMQRNHPGGSATPEPPRTMQSLGSGFIIDPSGIIVTNNHVIEGADAITVTLQDNTILKATLIGHDDRTDLAVLQVKPAKPLPAVTLGDSDGSRVGDWVLAIGNPFGLGGTVTAGIVSARGRDIRQGPYDDFIQTDAAINRGNSGGPLFNMSGQVIGINTAIYSPSGGSIGIGFSIPSNEAKSVVAQLRQYGHARRGWLGVRIQQVTPDIAESLGLHDPHGAMVAGLTDDAPASKAQMHNGDIILKFGNQEVKDTKALVRIVGDTAPGTEVPVTVWRNGVEQTLQAMVAEQPDDQQQAAAPQAPKQPAPDAPTELSGLGLKLAPITDDSRSKYSLNADQKGVVVTDVAPGGAAAQKGLKAGDVIVEVQQEAVANPGDVQMRVDRMRKQSRKTVLMLIQGADGLRWVPLPLSADAGQQPG